MTAIARNYRRNAHTARFLMAFHTAGGTALTEAPIAEYETPEHLGGSDGMVEVNRGRVAEDDIPAEGFGTPAPRDARTEGQVRYMDNLISWITEKDAEAGAAARTWTDKMTDAGKWVAGRDSNVSDWINRLKAKNAALNEAVKNQPRTEAGLVETAILELPTKLDKNGKPMALRYAVDIDGTTKFYRIKPGRKAGFWFIDVQASDEYHSIRNADTKRAIIKAIVAAGPDDCMARYGQLIGSCGRCGRTLTDADSRARGIGPDCLGKM